MPLPKHGGITLNSMIQAREKWNSFVLSKPDFWMVRRCHGIPWIYFYFLFRTNGKKRQLDENDLLHWYGNFFESGILKVTWSQQFERRPTNEDFTDMDQDTRQFFHQDLSKHHETIIKENAWKIISWTKIRACTSKNIETPQTTLPFLLYKPRFRIYLSAYWHIG